MTHALLVLGLEQPGGFRSTPLVNLLKRWLPRALAITVAYVLGLLVILGLVGIVVVSAASEISNVVQNLPTSASAPRRWNRRWRPDSHPWGFGKGRSPAIEPARSPICRQLALRRLRTRSTRCGGAIITPSWS